MRIVRIATLIATVVLGAGVVSAQSLGDVARQERTRRAGLEKHSRVLSNEDLSREQILPAEAKQSAASPAAAIPQRVVRAEALAPVAKRAVLPIGQTVRWEAPEVSLGEYARSIRAERARREARSNPEQVAEAKPEASEPQPRTPAVDSGVPAWTAAEQPNFSLGEYARAQRALRRKDAPIVLTLEAKATPAAAAPAPKPASIAAQRRKVSPSRPAAAPLAPSTDVIVVRSGDSLWKLSRAHLGEGRLWTAIWAANPQVHNPDRIHPGQSLSRPTEVQLAAARQAFSASPMVLAKLTPAPRTASRGAWLRPTGMRPAGNGGGSAGVRVVSVELERRSNSESYTGESKKNPAANRLVVPVSAGRAGLQ